MRIFAAAIIALSCSFPAHAAGADPAVSLSDRPLTKQDCRCISAQPTDDFDLNGRRAFRVTSSCNGLDVSVLFAEKAPADSMSNWAHAGLMGADDERILRAPAYEFTGVKAIGLRNGAGSLTCPLE